ncbi:hypothetical protein HanPI659440_Chr09g0351281 [Helianthus annuus]|nr:hypothetical protein HanPI659440_Chr09g0351281 [Helianthus annuus]
MLFVLCCWCLFLTHVPSLSLVLKLLHVIQFLFFIVTIDDGFDLMFYIVGFYGLLLDVVIYVFLWGSMMVFTEAVRLLGFMANGGFDLILWLLYVTKPVFL